MSDGKNTAWDELAPLREVRLKHWLQAVGSETPVVEARQLLREQDGYRDLARRWETLEPHEHEAAGAQLDELMRVTAYSTRPFCVHCGRCCRNAGPTLFPGDEALLLVGVITRAALRTLRVGEEVRSHHEGRLVVLEREQVTFVPGREGHCRFWNRAASRCSIHDQRPVQCRAQKCWDTSFADALMGRPGMTRLDLLQQDDPLREVVLRHEERCSPNELRRLAGEAAGDLQGEAAAALLELMSADLAIRLEAVDRDMVSEAQLPFALGRPLEEMLPACGLRVVYDSVGGATLAPSER